MKRQNFRKLLLILSFLLLPITQFYFSPFLIVMGVSQNIAAGSFVLFSLIFLGSLFLGRAFCGWIMPCGGMQEIFALANNKKVKQKKLRLIKFMIWVPWLILIALIAIKAGGIYKIDFFYQTVNGISIAMPWEYVIYYSVILIFLILSLTLGRRANCHAICWMSPFMITGRLLGRKLKIPTLKLVSEPSKCVDCKICESQCPMSLEVSKMAKTNMRNSECILCGACADSCPKKVISYKFGLEK